LTQPCGLHMLASSSHAVMMPGEHGTELTSVRSHVLRPLSRRRRRGCFLFQCARDTANPIGYSDPSFPPTGYCFQPFMSSEESDSMNQMQHPDPALGSIHLFLQALARGTAPDNYSVHRLEESLSSGCSTQTPFMFFLFNLLIAISGCPKGRRGFSRNPQLCIFHCPAAGDPCSLLQEPADDLLVFE
jgi:hypothetical protein